MFCPKCGSQNADGAKFCRGCGADVSYALAIAEGKVPAGRALAEKHIDLYTSGLRWLIIGVGLLIVAGVAFGISIRTAVLGLFALAFASPFLGMGIARLVQARALKRLREPKDLEPAATLSPGQGEYLRPAHYETDDLVTTPRSVTEHTTTHLKIDPGAETFDAPKK